jgi:hypothetical protein
VGKNTRGGSRGSDTGGFHRVSGDLDVDATPAGFNRTSLPSGQGSKPGQCETPRIGGDWDLIPAGKGLTEQALKGNFENMWKRYARELPARGEWGCGDDHADGVFFDFLSMQWGVGPTGRQPSPVEI